MGRTTQDTSKKGRASAQKSPMNNPSPLIPQGSMLERRNASRTRVRFAVFVVLSVHVAGLMALLMMQGCQKPPEGDAGVQTEADTNLVVEPFQPIDPPMEALMPPTNVIPELPQETAVMPVPPQPALTDNFTRIAQKFPGVTVKMIQEANPGVEPTRLQIGQKLKIPPPAPSPAEATVAESGQRIHVVKSGENLSRIAEQYGVTVQALREENNLSTTKILVGQKLKIPPPPNAPPPLIQPAQ